MYSALRRIFSPQTWGAKRKFGDPGGARTHDPLIKSQMLYQLSYRVKFRGESVRRQDFFKVTIRSLSRVLQASGKLGIAHVANF